MGQTKGEEHGKQYRVLQTNKGVLTPYLLAASKSDKCSTPHCKTSAKSETFKQPGPLVNQGILNLQCYHATSKVLNKHRNSFYHYKILLYKHLNLKNKNVNSPT
jgi:hypothetical protein